MNIIYAYCLPDYEAHHWELELSQLSNPLFKIIPFNFMKYLPPILYSRAQLLDNLYFEKNPNLLSLYDDTLKLIKTTKADVLVVFTFPPYHPDFLKKLDIYKVLRICDGPMSAYDRDIPYFHAYDHILYHSPAFSSDLTMSEKLAYCGVKRTNLLPLELFDFMHDKTKTENDILSHKRDIDIIFIGALWKNKMPILGKIKRHFRRKAFFYGNASLRKNVYFNVKYVFPCFFRPVSTASFVNIYQRAKIGINIHNRGKFTIGNYRLFDLPGNGVCQISDGQEYLESFFSPDVEIIGYSDADELINKVEYYLVHEKERNEIALNGFRCAKSQHTLKNRMYQMYEYLKDCLPSG